METITTYLVQFWVDRYDFWQNCAEPTTRMFEIAKVGFESEAEGRTKLSAMREAYPTGKYRLVRQITTVEEI